MIKFIQKWFLGWLGVYMYKSKRLRHPFVDWMMKPCLRTTRLEENSQTFVQQYETVLKETKYWHGTGVYQYSEDGAVSQTFLTIVEQNGLQPRHDVFDLSQGIMQSVSCTSIRSYARIYADMHQFGGARHHERCGAPFMWGYYFVVATGLMAIEHMGLWTSVRERHSVAKEAKSQMKQLWVRKVLSKEYVSFKDFFVDGSDIEDNFGVLIGIKKLNGLSTTSPYISMFETRTGQAIAVDDWSHLEVPRKNIKKVVDMLGDNAHRIPVLAIEDCEKYWSQKSFTELVRTPSRY